MQMGSGELEVAYGARMNVLRWMPSMRLSARLTILMAIIAMKHIIL